ncbi:hypothetical protein D9M69_596400 [compost metagenome]
MTPWALAYAWATITSRWRSASARIFSPSAAPMERSSLATRVRSASMRRYTDSEISGANSIRRRRTSTICTPMGSARLATLVRISAMILPRSVETTSRTVRTLTDALSASRISACRRSCATRSLPPVET